MQAVDDKVDAGVADDRRRKVTEQGDGFPPEMIDGYYQQLEAWWHRSTGSEVDIIKRMTEMILADTRNRARFALGTAALISCALTPNLLLRRHDLFVPWPKEGKEYASARTAVGTQNGIINALIKAGLITRSGTGTHTRYASHQKQAVQAIINAVDGDGSLLKLALWPAGYAPDVDGTQEAEEVSVTGVDPEASETKVRIEQRQVQVDALIMKQFAGSLPEIIRILTSLDAGVKSSMGGTERILTALDRQRQAMELESSAFSALKEMVQTSRDGQMKAVREIGARVEAIAASVARAAEGVPLAALLEQLKLSYEQALHSAEICDLVKTRVEGMLSKPGGERG